MNVATMGPAGYTIGDGSWDLTICVTDFSAERTLRVKGDNHIGGVMLKLVEELDFAQNWSDHALWWPAKNMWLTHTRSTLDQYGVTAAAMLEFTPMHKNLRVQLPDLRVMDFKVDFSIKTFNAIVQLCKEMGIRHPEEMSFCKPLSPDDLKKNYCERVIKNKKNSGKNGIAPDTNSYIVNKSHNSSNGSLDRTVNNSHSTPNKSMSSPGGAWPNSFNGYNSFNSSLEDTIDSVEKLNLSLCNSPPTRPDEAARRRLVRPKTLLERARLNVGWLDSSLSIMEQGISENDTLLLRFKFCLFYDLNPKYDMARINLIYEQAKWAILNEEIDCTEEEMLMFAALQLQVYLQMNSPQPDHHGDEDDDINKDLNELQSFLEGNTQSSSIATDITQIPELKAELKFMKHKKFTMNRLKSYFFIYKDMTLRYYKMTDNYKADPPVETLRLQGCEVTPDVIMSQQRYAIKLEVPSEDGMSEFHIRCSSADQYSQWMAAFRLASKGKSLADSSYNIEVKSIQTFLAMQAPGSAPAINVDTLDISPEDYLAPRFLKKIRNKQAVQRILEAHGNVKDLTLMEAKQQFIRFWQALPEYGIAYFLVKHREHKHEELLGVAFNRIMRLDAKTGDHIKTWRYNSMKAWNVNWETRQMMIQFEGNSVIFSCLTADCKVIHEFIGGYLFLSMRTKNANQTLNDELFHKLTGGWH